VATGVFFDDDQSRRRFARPRVLLVEGQDDCYFFDSLLQEIGADPTRVGMRSIKGIDDLANQVAVLVRDTDFVRGVIQRYAIICDSDQSPNNALNRVAAALVASNQPVPAHATFTPAPQGGAEVGVFLLPSNVVDGDLERVCLDTIPTDLKLIATQQFLTQVQQTFGPLDKRYKRLARIFLSICDTETFGVGRTFALGGVFDRTHPSLDPLRTFLQMFVA
jgi:hypothetical protein